MPTPYFSKKFVLKGGWALTRYFAVLTALTFQITAVLSWSVMLISRCGGGSSSSFSRSSSSSSSSGGSSSSSS